MTWGLAFQKPFRGLIYSFITPLYRSGMLVVGIEIRCRTRWTDGKAQVRSRFGTSALISLVLGAITSSWVDGGKHTIDSIDYSCRSWPLSLTSEYPRFAHFVSLTTIPGVLLIGSVPLLRAIFSLTFIPCFQCVCVCSGPTRHLERRPPRSLHRTDWLYSLNGITMTSKIDQEPLISRLSAPTEAQTTIECLPTELLLCVLELVLDSENPPELFCLVSRRWYRSVVTCAPFWRCIDITVECYRRVDPATGLVPNIRRHLARSDAYGLDVTIDYGAACAWDWDSQFWDAVLECVGLNGEGMSRWSTLKFNATQNTPLRIIDVFQHPTPALRELSICVGKEIDMTLLFPHAPLLRVLHVPSIMGTITWPLAFRRLVSTLHVNDSQYHGISNLIHSVPSIRTLHLGSTVFTGYAGLGDSIELLHLRELHASVPDFPLHLPVLYFPCLTHLTLTCQPLRCLNHNVTPDTCDSYGAILNRIENLTILRMGCSTAGDLVQLLTHALNVRVLGIQACGRWVGKDDTGRWLKQPVLVEEFYNALESRELCPRLSHCRINGVDRLDLVELRREPTS